MTSLGWRLARRVGPHHPATPLGLAEGGEPWRPRMHQLLAPGRRTAVRRGLAAVPAPRSRVGVPIPVARGDAVVVLPSAAPWPVAGAWGGGGGDCSAVPSWSGRQRRKGERRCRPSAPARGLGGLGGGGGGSLPVPPPSASLVTLWHFCVRWAPFTGPCSDARFLPPASRVWLSHSQATGDGASGALWSPGSRGHCSQRCMPLAAETRSVYDSLRMPGRMT